MKETICRAVTYPIAPVGIDWKILDAILLPAWRESTALANWSVLELIRHDVGATAGTKSLPPYPHCRCGACRHLQGGIYLYGHFKKYAGRKSWDGAAAAANCILRNVQAKYLRERGSVLWRCARALPTYRFPYPFPVHNQSWACRIEGQDRVPTVALSLPGGRVEVRMANRAEMRRQETLFRLLANGEAKRGEAAIYRKGKHALLKLVGHFPRKEQRGLAGTLCVRTDPNAFWVSEQDGRAPWILNADHVRRWVATHRCYLQRLSEDTKHEKRWPQEMRDHINRARELRCRKHNDRIGTWCHEATKMLAEFALRQKAAEVLYDDSIQSYVESFPWARLKELLKNKLDERGIVLNEPLSASGKVVA